MLNSENCETSYEEIQRMRRAKKRAEFKAQVKHYAKIGFCIALPFIIIGLLVGLIGYKDSTEVIVKQSRSLILPAMKLRWRPITMK